MDTEGILPLDSIKKLYPNEWILLALTDKNDDAEKEGIVLFHSPDKREMALKGRDLIKNHAFTTHFYTGEFPKIAKIGVMRRISQ